MHDVKTLGQDLKAWVRSNHMLHDAIISEMAFSDVVNKTEMSPFDGVFKIGLKIPRNISSSNYVSALLSLNGVLMMRLDVMFMSCPLYILRAGVSVETLPNLCEHEILRLKIFGEECVEMKWVEKMLIDIAFVSYDRSILG